MLPNLLFAQAKFDSLWSIWSDESQSDTNRLKAIKDIGWSSLVTLPDSAFYYAKLQLDFAKEKGERKYIANALNTQGVSFYIQSSYKKALDYQERSLKINKEIGNKNGIANSLINIGNIYGAQGDYTKAIDAYTESLIIQEEIGNKNGVALALNNIGLIYNDQGETAKAIASYTKSLIIQEEIENKSGIASTLNNIGIIYKEQGETNKAMDYYTRSLNIQEEIGDKSGITKSLNNIGNIYKTQGEGEKAITYYTKSLTIQEEIGDKRGAALALNNIGSIYTDQGKIAEAMVYYLKSLTIREKIGDKNGIAHSLNNIGNIYYMQGEYAKGLNYGKRSLFIAKEINNAIQIRNAAELLWRLNKAMGRFKESLVMYELYIASRDSIDSEKIQRAVIQQEYKYAYEKQAVADSIKAAEAVKVKDALLLAEIAENKQNRQQKYFLYAGLVLALLFGGFIFNRFKLANKQKGIIAQQKHIVDKAYDELQGAHKEITDSIQYARRIQSAILPADKLVKEYLAECFVLYKPKDVVAGDFYWVELKNKKVLFAVADCTGHGVPGAMVSVVCNNALNRSVREYDLTNPAEILDKTREIIISEFEKSEDDVQDGMDIALCTLEGNILQYAGAHNPLWIVRNGEVMETKANKQPIGKYDNLLPYTCHTFEVQKGDSIYIFSDGYVDQFGGDKEKKFKSRAFKELLISVQKKPMDEQRKFIDEAFESWRGDLEQVDDVCIVGLRV